MKKLFLLMIILFFSINISAQNAAWVKANIKNLKTLTVSHTASIAAISDGTTAFTIFTADSGVIAGQDVFTTTGETDTVLVTGMVATDLVLVTGVFTSAVDQQDVLQTEALAGKFVVHRLASGESELKYNWFWITTE